MSKIIKTSIFMLVIIFLVVFGDFKIVQQHGLIQSLVTQLQVNLPD
jgi:hypothetical protein